MAFSAQKNQIFHERVKNYARAQQNLREEGERLRAWYFQEITSNEFFVDVEASTAAECTAMMNYMEQHLNMNNNEEVTQNNWGMNLIPFLADDPA